MQRVVEVGSSLICHRLYDVYIAYMRLFIVLCRPLRMPRLPSLIEAKSFIETS